MFDAFRKHPGKTTAAHAEDLQALILASREERAALSTMLTQIQVHAAKLAAAAKASQDAVDLDGRLARLTTQVQVVEHVETRLDTLGSLAESIETRIQQAQGLASDVERAAAVAGRLMEELARVEARQREVVSRGEVVDAQVRRIAEASQQLQARQSARIEANERLVNDVHGKTAAIAAMLEDVRVKMETIGEHRATIDGVLASFSELGSLVLEAQSTLGAVQARHAPVERRRRGVRGQRGRQSQATARKTPA